MVPHPQKSFITLTTGDSESFLWFKLKTSSRWVRSTHWRSPLTKWCCLISAISTLFSIVWSTLKLYIKSYFLYWCWDPFYLFFPSCMSACVTFPLYLASSFSNFLSIRFPSDRLKPVISALIASWLELLKHANSGSGSTAKAISIPLFKFWINTE